ncbi:serine/threonine protein kinase [Helicocarpus griseus UAMH5409]|uniref:Serine/threonine protein kinase n=1 Tax=Helicocarpus griseus UAMH5409 TaxID=1447875 RepID=A0A2B7WSH1_9EURO|nr:serine/threonine protein kinase [Helicocarpus griseus UAMH5409]
MTQNSIPEAVPQHNNDSTGDFGIFVSTEDEESDLQDAVEPWHRYDTKDNPRVLYPICLEVLNNRYLIEHKLGSGGFSTVWMAYDLGDKRDVALKVMSLKTEIAENEIRIQDKIRRKVPDSSHLVTYLATFHLPRDGNEGQHRVLYNVETEEDAHGNPYVCGQAVASDLNDTNCMWGSSPLHNFSRSVKYKTLGRPLKQIIPFVNLWKKGELVQPAEVPESLRTERFYLGDFGAAMELGDSDPFAPQLIYPPMEFCSPDRLHGKPASFACDMWSYMVIFAELYLGFPPFPTVFNGNVISGIVKSLGPLPEQWKGTYNHPGALDYWYDQSETPDPKLELAAKIARCRPEADPTEQKHVLNVMSKVFTRHSGPL